jgi:DNA-binding transcriptional MerR regulator
MAEISYTLGDLIAAASAAERLTLSERVARQYVAEGLLAPPRGRGMTVAYAEQHLMQLRMVLRLASQYVPLPEIRRWMQTLSDGQLQALLDRPAVPRLPAEGDVQAYLARLLKTLPRAPSPATPRAPLRAAPPRAPRRAAAAPSPPPAPSAERSVWLRVSVSPEVELLVRARGSGVPAQTIDRLVAAVQAVLADGMPDKEGGSSRR